MQISVAAVQKLLCGLVVPHEVKAQGSASLAALSALCMYLKRCNANEELATRTHKVASMEPLLSCACKFLPQASPGKFSLLCHQASACC